MLHLDDQVSRAHDGADYVDTSEDGASMVYERAETLNHPNYVLAPPPPASPWQIQAFHPLSRLLVPHSGQRFSVRSTCIILRLT